MLETDIVRELAYAAPRTVPEAVALLQQYGPRARVLAGGTDLIVQIREYLREVDLVVDAKRIPELLELSFDPSGGLTLGAAVPCCEIYAAGSPAHRYPALIDAASIIGGTAIQGRASVGGNLCNAGPAADSIPPLIVHRATARIAGPSGTRSVPVEEFCTAPGRSVLAPGELLVALRLPPPEEREGSHYLRFIPRNEMDIAEVGAAACLQFEADGVTIRSARVALAAVAPRPLFVPEAGALLAGRAAGEESWAAAGESARAACSPISDHRGTADHRRHLVGVLTVRALRRAHRRATGGD